jgi:hypothetical protein
MRQTTLALFLALLPAVVCGQKPLHADSVVLPSKLVLHQGQVLSYVAAGITPHAIATPVHSDTPLRLASLDTKGKVRIAGLAYAVDGGGLRYDPASDVFRGTLHVWLEDQDHAGDVYPLPRAVPINIFTEADTATPLFFQFAGTEAPQTVTLTVRSPADFVRVQLWPTARVDSVTALVRVLPALRVRVIPPEVAGFGLETAVISVQLWGDAHGDFGAAVTPRFAEANPPQLTLQHAQAKSSTIRSRGLGRDTITVTAPGVAPAVAVVIYAFPLAFLVAVMAGGGLGTVVLALQAPRAKATSPAARLVALGRGLLVGLVAAVAYAVGVKAINIPIPPQYGEAGVFLVAALAVILGLRRR